MGAQPLRVVLADAHRPYRCGLRDLLIGSVDVVAEAENGADAFDCIMQHQPDVALLDDQLPGGCSVAVTRRLRAYGSTVGILVLTTFEDSPYIKAALDAGANGYVLKLSDAQEMLDAIDAVYDASCVVTHFQRKEANP